jgi:hypothetical protein
MAERLGRPTTVDRIPSRWFRSGLSGIAAVMIFIGLILGILQGTFSHESLAYQALGSTIAVGFVALLLSVLVYTQFVGEVGIATNHVDFKLGRRRVRVGWKDLVAPRSDVYPVVLLT